jgi:hypothetical protein
MLLQELDHLQAGHLLQPTLRQVERVPVRALYASLTITCAAVLAQHLKVQIEEIGTRPAHRGALPAVDGLERVVRVVRQQVRERDSTFFLRFR